MIATATAPHFDWHALSPILALSAGMIAALMLGLLPGRAGRLLATLSGVAAAAVTIGLAADLWNEPTARKVIADSLVMDRPALAAIVFAAVSAIAALAIAARSRGTTDAGHGETAALVLASAVGMAILAGANDLVTVFLGLELLSIPLYVLCASHVDRAASLESGLKYLILGSVGSATALMGIALIYGATGSMQLDEIAQTAGNSELRGLIVPGVGLLVAGFAFKLSLAPLHQWTPDVYDGAPTAVTAFMSVATKAAALVVTARLVWVGLEAQHDLWYPMLLTLAAISIVVGNVGALGQPGMKRLMGYSSIAQAGYLVAALAVGAIGAMLAYLAAYAAATLLIFAVIAAREVERPDLGDDVTALDGLATERPLLAWFGTIGFFGLAGLPLTAGFFAKIGVAGALIDRSETWLAVLLIVGSIISLAYYAPPVLRMWRPAVVPATDGLLASIHVPVAAPAPAPALAMAGGTPPVVASVDSGATAAAGTAAGSASASATAARLVPGAAPTAEDAGPAVPVGRRAPWEIIALGGVMALLTVAGGLYPQPIFDLASDALSALFNAR